MKKTISILLTLILIFGLSVPAFAAEEYYTPTLYGKVPLVRIHGDGMPLADAEGNELLNYKGLLKLFEDDGEEGDDGDNAVLEAVFNIVMPFLLDGLVTDNWEPYYDALYNEISDIFADSLLDPDGNPEPGSGVPADQQSWMASDLKRNKVNSNGEYQSYAYRFYYDWRIDPLETADKLAEYIEGVKAITGFDRIALQGNCLGSSVVLAYVQKYGTEDICYLGIDISVAGGAEILSHPISGQFNLDGEALDRFLVDCDAIGLFGVDDFLKQTIDLVAATGLVDMLGTGIKETIYEKLVYGVTSALARSTFYTFPTYWAAVEAEDFEIAKDYVFGPEGSEKRQEYAGLIAKIDNYHETVRTRIPEILAKVDGDENCALAIFAKYGLQIAPIVRNTDAVGDQFASLTNASFGATTSSIFDTLSDEYIALRESEGKGKYISPDKQVDTSTCLYPDNTFIIKNLSHGKYCVIEDGVPLRMAEAITYEGKKLTVDDFEVGNFIVYDYDTDTVSKMTAENCDTYNWNTDEKPLDPDDKIGFGFRIITKLILWLIEVIGLLVEKFGA